MSSQLAFVKWRSLTILRVYQNVWTDIVNTIKNFIGTKHHDRITVFASLNGEEYGATADVACEGYRSNSSTGSADKFTRAGIFEGIDTSIDTEFSSDDGVIATEDFV